MSDVRQLETALTVADSHLGSGMWEEALHVLEQLPVHLKEHHLSFARRIDALSGMERWTRALALAKKAVLRFPLRAELWHRQARLQNQAGDVQAARLSVGRCIDLDSRMRETLVQDEKLIDIWYT
jgi:hypothetical protein